MKKTRFASPRNGPWRTALPGSTVSSKHARKGLRTASPCTSSCTSPSPGCEQTSWGSPPSVSDSANLLFCRITRRTGAVNIKCRNRATAFSTQYLEDAPRRWSEGDRKALRSLPGERNLLLFWRISPLRGRPKGFPVALRDPSGATPSFCIQMRSPWAGTHRASRRDRSDQASRITVSPVSSTPGTTSGSSSGASGCSMRAMRRCAARRPISSPFCW